jgi:uncharacterized phiE125 gp8 family phage protein
MPFVVVTPPPALPVSIVEAASYLRVDDLEREATTIHTLIDAATRYLDGPDGVLGRALVTTTYDLVLDAFPAGGAPIMLLPPVQSVTAIAYRDQAGDEQAWTDYAVDLVSGRVVPAYGTTYPTTRAVPNAVSVRFTAGHPAAAVDRADKLIVLLLVAHYFENREPVVVGQNVASVPLHVERLIDARRRLTV